MGNIPDRSTRRIKAKAFAKINLSLDIVGKRSDGYHEVKMIMQSITLHDFLTFTPAPTLSLHTSESYLPVNDQNLIIKAAKLLKQYAGIKSGAEIYLQKNIPVGAGLGGGSADAAATLMALNQLWGLHLDTTDLRKLAVSIGADVPFCITGGTVLAGGIGEKLTPLPALPKVRLLLAKPPFSVKTKEVYGKYDTLSIISHPQIMKVVDCIKSGKFWEITNYWGNVLEEVTLQLHPTLKIHMHEFACFGLPVRMTGSGPTIFALLPEGFTELDELKKKLNKDNWWVYESDFHQEGNQLLVEEGGEHGEKAITSHKT
ncbi:MAG TPA: 4-(cytidine 5'-diphospho)-2-C-methyl-D-erythritol kinase [Bacillota bacterium]